MESRAKDIMTDHPAYCTPETSLQDAAKMMADNDCGCLPVVQSKQSKKLMGVITDRDIACRAVAQGKDPKRETVAGYMSRNLVSVSPDASIDDCCTLMEQKQIRRLPVVDNDNNCVGMVSQGDIAGSTEERKVAEVVREVSKPSEMASSAGSPPH